MEQYYWLDAKNQRQGPVTANELPKYITGNTLVWKQGMNGWQKAETVQELAGIFQNVAPPPPPTPSSPYQYQNQYQNAPAYVQDDTLGFGWSVLAFLIPISGLIMFFAWTGKTPKRAKYALFTGIAGFVFGCIIYNI